MLNYAIIPVYWNTDKTTALESMGLNFNINECRLNNVYIFNIDYIYSDSTNITCFGCGDGEYQTSLTIEELLLKVSNLK